MKKVLAIDGGGIRGIIPALILNEIEKKTGKKTSELFDLIAGTSTGGIIALTLSVKGDGGSPRYRASELAELYEKYGRDIFERSFWKGMSSIGSLADEKYGHANNERIRLQDNEIALSTGHHAHWRANRSQGTAAPWHHYARESYEGIRRCKPPDQSI